MRAGSAGTFVIAGTCIESGHSVEPAVLPEGRCQDGKVDDWRQLPSGVRACPRIGKPTKCEDMIRSPEGAIRADEADCSAETCSASRLRRPAVRREGLAGEGETSAHALRTSVARYALYRRGPRLRDISKRARRGGQAAMAL